MKYRKELIIAIAYISVSFALSYFKYASFLYTQLDLAIFTNALSQPWSNALWSSIQGHHYFGDHFAPYLFLFKPWIDLFKSPLILLFLQSVIIASTIIPLTAILRKIFGPKGMWNFPLQILFFANPITIGINLYEFHPEVLLLPLLFATFYFYLENNFKFFSIFFCLSLIVREDTVIALIAFSLLALLDRRQIKWVIFPLISLPYAFVALKIIGYFNPTGQSIFLSYYSWLGSSFSQAIINGIAHPWLLIKKLSTIYVFEFILASLMFVLFLPIFRPKYLIFAILPYLELALGPGQDITILRTHYAIAIFFSLTISGIFGLEKLLKSRQNFISNYKNLLLIISGISLIYLNVILGPYPLILKHLRDPFFRQNANDAREIIKKIRLGQPTLSSYQFLPYLKTNEQYFLGYAVAKKQQRSTLPYLLPQDLEQIVVDVDDFITFQVNSLPTEYKKYEANFLSLIKGYELTSVEGKFLIFKKSENAQINPLNSTVSSEGKTLKITYINGKNNTEASEYWSIIFKDFINTRPNFKISKIEEVQIKGVHVLDALGSTKRVIFEEKVISGGAND